MGDKINKEFEDFQKELKKKDKKIKYVPSFETSDKLENVIKELKNKEVTL